jgi:hypothetical protein
VVAVLAAREMTEDAAVAGQEIALVPAFGMVDAVEGAPRGFRDVVPPYRVGWLVRPQAALKKIRPTIRNSLIWQYYPNLAIFRPAWLGLCPF